MDKKKKSRSKKIAGIRGWIQAVATLLTNIHIPNLFKGKIYQGNAKAVCVPGLNCYSCPAATGACPIGAFQAVVGSSRFKFSYYITGFFILLGVTPVSYTHLICKRKTGSPDKKRKWYFGIFASESGQTGKPGGTDRACLGCNCGQF